MPVEVLTPLTPAQLPQVRAVKPATPRLPTIAPPLKFPVPSRFTIAFAVFALVGATFQFSPSVPVLVTGEPLTVKYDDGALRPTLATLPALGNDCPETNDTLPVWSTLKVVPLMARVGSAPLGNRVSVSRTSPLPLTSSVDAGAIVAMPIWEFFWKISELMMSLVESHMGIKSSVPLPVTAGFAGAFFLVVVEAADAGFVLAVPGALLVRTKAEGGRPPIVSASAAFKAYGTLSSTTRACSSPPFTRTPSQRASPELKRSSGKPSGLVAP